MTKGQGSQGSGSPPPPPPPPPRPAQPLDRKSVCTALTVLEDIRKLITCYGIAYGARFTRPNRVNLSIGFMLLMMTMSGIGAAVSLDSCKSQGVLFTATFTPIGCICYLPVGNDVINMSSCVQRSIKNFEGASPHAYKLQVEVVSEIYPSTSDAAERDVSKAVACNTDTNFLGSARIADRFDIQLIFHKDERSETAKRTFIARIDSGIVNICSGSRYTMNTLVSANRRSRLTPSTF